jgi:PTH1 family peptidyl-tRNA hydrolase
MIIIIGLGNPGEKFKNTRHNVGFIAIDYFAEKNNFPGFKLDKKSNALVSEQKNILLAKPQTFMNESGKSAESLIKNLKLKIKNFIVIHDDVDLPVGKIKIVKNRGSAGHKGVESIIKAIGNKNLIRFRIGIKLKQFHALNHGTKKAQDIVLKKFSKQEQETINQAIEKATEALDFLIKNGLDKAMNEYNK